MPTQDDTLRDRPDRASAYSRCWALDRTVKTAPVSSRGAMVDTPRPCSF